MNDAIMSMMTRYDCKSSEDYENALTVNLRYSVFRRNGTAKYGTPPAYAFRTIQTHHLLRGALSEVSADNPVSEYL